MGVCCRDVIMLVGNWVEYPGYRSLYIPRWLMWYELKVMIFISCMMILMIFTNYRGWGITGDERKSCDVGDVGPKRGWTEFRCYFIFPCRVL